MRSVNVRFLRPGQVLADAITNSSGAVLCPLGYTLTEVAIERLKNGNVGSVWIEGDPDAGPDVDALDAKLSKRFKGVTNPSLLRIKSLFQKRVDLLREEFGG